MLTITKSRPLARKTASTPSKRKARLSASWYQAAGLLRHKSKALDKHMKQLRQEW